MNHYTNTYTLCVCVHSQCVTQCIPKSKRPKKIKIPSFIRDWKFKINGILYVAYSSVSWLCSLRRTGSTMSTLWAHYSICSVDYWNFVVFRTSFAILFTLFIVQFSKLKYQIRCRHKVFQVYQITNSCILVEHTSPCLH